MFKKFGRSRPDQIQEVDEADSAILTEPGGDQEHQKKASESSRETSNSSLPRSDTIDLPPSPRRTSTSSSSFLTIGSQLSRKSSGSKAPQTSDPLGLTLIHESDRPLADLIFVHGLGGSSRKTWSCNRDVENFWLPWLGSEVGLSNTRIFTFGYNAHFAQQSTTLSILDFAKDLLFQTKMYHHTDKEESMLIGQHPLIFVVHSMGGLVVKKAYIIGKTDDQYSEMISQTYAIVFLGTPHRGSGLAHTLNNILRASPNVGTKVYVNELEKGSTSLEDINEQFRNVCGDLVLVSFHETLKTPIAPGVRAMIVEKESAILGYPTETSAPLHADHHGMTKFPHREDRNYRDVRNVLRMFVQRIKELGKPRNKVIEPASPASSANLDTILGITDMRDDLDIFRQKILPGSCHWILQKDSFRNWAEDNRTSTVFWLTGLPATGKTILSSFLIDYLSQASIPGTCQYHFFQAEHHDTRTVSFLLRSLAFQIAEKYDVFHDMLLEMHQETGLAWASQKYNLVWEKLFEGLLFRLNLDGPLFWVLDGLDEAESPPALVSLISKIRSATPIKVLLVSRYTKDLSAALGGDNYPIHHEEIQISDTAGDIRSYVSTIIRQTLPNDKEQDTVIESILSKASGSFLWVRLALERIKDSWHTKDDIERALTEIPEGMELMYERMIEMVARQPPRLRRMATEILSWTACSFRPLDLDELAVALKPEFGHFFNLEVTVAQICGNFVVTEKSKVSLIHQTARQFLVSKNPHLPISIDSRRSHEHIATVCMSFLSDNKWRTRLAMAQKMKVDPNSNNPAGPFSDVPFLWYATSHWAYHVSCASAELEDLQSAVFNFLERFSLLWINAVALAGNLRIIIRSAQYLKAYAKRKAHHRTEASPSSLRSSREEELHQWATDFIRLVGRFGVYLADNPSSIYKHVIPFCPTESIIRQTFSHLSRSAMSVGGISSGKWDDCLARLTMGGDETASKVICKDNYFITLLGSSGTIILWHAETCSESRRLHHGEYVTGIKASKIKSLLASAGIRTIRVWDITTGQEVYNIPRSNQGRLMALAFTANDTKLLVAYDDCTVRCINLQSSREEWCFHAQDPLEPGHGCPRLMVFSPDAKRVAVAHRGRPVFVWWISRQRQAPQCCIRREDLYKRDGDVWNAPEVVVWQPESSNVLILYQDTVLVDWNMDDDTRTEHSHIGAREMVVSSDGNLLLTSDHNGTLSVWSTGEFQLIYRLEYDEFVRDIAFSPDAQRFYDIRGTLCNVWEPDALIRSDDTSREDLSTHDTLYSGPVVSSHDNSRIQVSALICGETGQYYCTGKEDGSVVIYELDTVEKLRKLYGHSTTVAVVDIAWSASLKYIASVDDSGRVIAKRLAKPTPRAPKKWAVYPLLDLRIGSTVTQLLFSASEEFLLICSATSDRVWSTKTKKELFRVQHRDGNGNNRRWIQHPHEPRLLVCVEGEEQYLCQWSTLEAVPHPPIQAKRLELGINTDEVLSDNVHDLTLRERHEDFLPQDATPIMSSSTPPPSDTLERVFQIRDRYLILECQSSRGFSFNRSGVSNPSGSRRLEVIDVDEASSGGSLQRRSLPQLSAKVNRLVGLFQGRVVFLDHQYWLCTWELLDGKDDEVESSSAYRRHFFLPKDWLSPGTLNLITLNQFGTLLCPKDGEVAIVRSGIRM